jgi:myo-inositol-1(or 4)-monophosphatase
MLDRAFDVAVDAAMAAGAVVRGYYKDEYTVRDKGEDNPVTDADLASNAVIEDKIRTAFPDHGWLSEESKDDPIRLEKSHTWIIDPVDGTKEFTLGIPEFVVSVALVVEGNATIGVLYNPIKDQLFAGMVGAGATLNGAPVKVTEHRAVLGARIVCSRTEMKKGWFEQYANDGIEPMPVGSVAYKFGLVAAGLAEATFTPRPRNEWDIAGGVALVEAAGGRCTNRHGQPYRFNQANPLRDGVCGTNGLVHEGILGLMQRG